MKRRVGALGLTKLLLAVTVVVTPPPVLDSIVPPVKVQVQTPPVVHVPALPVATPATPVATPAAAAPAPRPQATPAPVAVATPMPAPTPASRRVPAHPHRRT